ncbi:hypothetical protein LIER_30113 [Lithospermum erythrorhizon]|uniref:Uncharacterized protein n=1 Tax=Lithospermum erythrorhizon TaxID=34254 RepID=A0AAV3RND3_LITER
MRKKRFDFHPCYEQLKLTNVCFADDFFLVAGATVKSFKTIKKSLNNFGKMTSLHPNLDKSLKECGHGDWLRGKKLWSIKEKSTHSWIWRKFLKLRDYAKKNINIRVGNGKVCNFLFDNWHELGPLHLVLTSQEVSYIGVKCSDSVAEVMGRGKIIEGRRTTLRI